MDMMFVGFGGVVVEGVDDVIGVDLDNINYFLWSNKRVQKDLRWHKLSSWGNSRVVQET